MTWYREEKDQQLCRRMGKGQGQITHKEGKTNGIETCNKILFHYERKHTETPFSTYDISKTAKCLIADSLARVLGSKHRHSLLMGV